LEEGTSSSFFSIVAQWMLELQKYGTISTSRDSSWLLIDFRVGSTSTLSSLFSLLRYPLEVESAKSRRFVLIPIAQLVLSRSRQDGIK
jgi:hypothetical protein